MSVEGELAYICMSIHARIGNIIALLKKGTLTLEGLETIDEQARVMRQDARELSRAVKGAIKAEVEKGR